MSATEAVVEPKAPHVCTEANERPPTESGVAAPVKRLFDLLQEDSKERVVRLLTAFRELTLLEQESLAQEMGVTLPKEEKWRAPCPLIARQPSGPSLEVRRRDPSYVALCPSVSSALRELGSKEAARRLPDADLRKLVEGALGEDGVYLTVPESDGEGCAAASERVGVVDDGKPPLLVRSRCYQALRLARDEEIETDAQYTRPRVLNVTGIPLEESDVWEWFNLLDVARNGTVGVDAFLTSVRELDRGFGTSSKVQEAFEDESRSLSVDGQLSFDKFAYLVTRFSRY
ncbi:paraflagellar rod component, putative [Trypanosoma equiperdum]|uniref:Paraflagellar rod component, putative n=1 Tax=Trypanosoma equiperdum TaxID=5694 RepID=A0A1G4I320_TRYEQ|nr:paraflagellar rod component, putative [Trypanosoma equiperdum]